MDLGRVECVVNGARQTRYFAQLAGAGLDARAIDLVNWKLKKKIGPLAYVLAGMQALREKPSQITVTAGTASATGELVLVGNGRLYGGHFRVFPEANLRDGLLDIRVIPRTNWFTLFRFGLSLLTTGRLPQSAGKCLHTNAFSLASDVKVRLEVDGESVGELPAVFSVEPGRLRVLVP
jgi:diacylglycerol kinase family enzyme